MKGFFRTRSYKQLVRERIGQLPNHGYGARRRLAEACQCQTAYLSQVLNGNAHFSLEQAEAVSRFFRFSEIEVDYFLTLVQWERAGTSFLKSRFKQQLDQIAEKANVVQKRIDIKKTLSAEEQAIYYSDWSYLAVHMALTIPRCANENELQKILNLPSEKLRRILDFLVTSGIAAKTGATYQVNLSSLHLPESSPWITSHHINWRLRAIQAIEKSPSDGVHYSGVITVSRRDAEKLRQLFLETLESMVKIAAPSLSEEMLVVSMDLFSLFKNKEGDLS